MLSPQRPQSTQRFFPLLILGVLCALGGKISAVDGEGAEMLSPQRTQSTQRSFITLCALGVFCGKKIRARLLTRAAQFESCFPRKNEMHCPRTVPEMNKCSPSNT
jgi:hypothetical protein